MAARIRRGPLMLALVFYSVIEVLSGLAPNYMSFLVLRALFGIGMGGEWGVGTSLAMEAAPAKKRGFLSGILIALPYALARALTNRMVRRRGHGGPATAQPKV
jgi:MFS family permease